jgi:hypothetical protein
MFERRSLVAVAGLAALCALPAANAADMTLTSAKTDAAPAIDGAMDAAWSKAAPLEVLLDQLPYEPSNGYPGMRKTTVTLRAMHDADNLYMLIQYADPTQSLERFPWVKQADGSWKQTSNKDSTGHENTYYEDKLAILWDINARGFAKKGCAAACHLAKDGMNNGIADTAPGRKYTSKEGQTIDMWHWKSVRVGPVGMFDDQFIDHVADPKVNENWGRHGDAKTGGGYSNNKTKDGKMPAFMPKDGKTGGYWLVKADAVPFVDTFKEGDVLPGIVISPFEGSRADISAQGVYKDGMWTVELKRALHTTGDKADTQDVQFTDMGKSYPFGVAVFDNSQINHVFHEGVVNLVFGK